MQHTTVRPRLHVTTGGKRVVSHVGARLLCDLADVLGVQAGLSQALAPTKQRRRGHDRGQVLVDLAVALADGATTLTDILSRSWRTSHPSLGRWPRWRRSGAPWRP
ncbi:MAG: hypothetical protein K6U14_10930 [Firmicutes bacterium]|nr:hypothetical protein [Alicyclobacillaceae bacterium]MCL6498126.1 hypothetical protein [Bacillota bacterium]